MPKVNFEGLTPNRFLAEWARTHLMLPYGYGAKDKYINEDCSGLFTACALASGAIKKEKLGIWSAPAIADNALGRMVENGPDKDTFEFVPLTDGTKPKTFITSNTVQGFKSEISKRAIQPGDLIAHRKSWGVEVKHMVIVQSVVRNQQGQITSLDVIEAQGYDDKNEANRINSCHSNAECTVLHDYITQYVELKDTNTNQPYIGDVYIIRIKPKK